MRTINRKIVSALIFSKDGKLFQGKKDPNQGGVYNDCWHIPGGGIDDGEEKLQALVREIREEIGIDISKYKVELIDDVGRGESKKILPDGEEVICEMKFNIYKIVISDLNAEDIKVSLDDDLVEYHWVNIEDLKIIKLTPPSVELFTRLGYI